jgi:hypothetical protein
MSDNVCLSGGARGADTVWSMSAKAAGHDVIPFGFKGMKSEEPIWVLKQEVLNEVDEHLEVVSKQLERGRGFPYSSDYVNNLLRRNYFQVKDSERVYAVAPIDKEKGIEGGTAWAVHLAVKLKIKEIYIYNLKENAWRKLKFSDYNLFALLEGCIPPKPHGIYTGIGSREITPEGIKAIKDLYV